MSVAHPKSKSKLFLQPTPKTRAVPVSQVPQMVPQKVEGVDEVREENLPKIAKEAPDAGFLAAEERWWWEQTQRDLAEAVAPVPDEAVAEVESMDGGDSISAQLQHHAAPVEPEAFEETPEDWGQDGSGEGVEEGSQETPQEGSQDLAAETRGDTMVETGEDMAMDDTDSIHPSELDELEKQISAETERVQALERNLMVPPEEDSDTEEEEGLPHTPYPPKPKEQKPKGRAGRKSAKSEDRDTMESMEVIERLGISPEALLMAPATPPMKPRAAGAAPRTPPLDPEAKEPTAEDAKALEKLVSLIGAPGTPPRSDPKSPKSKSPAARSSRQSHSPVLIPTSTFMKTEPDREVYQHTNAKSLEELFQQGFGAHQVTQVPVKLQTDDDAGLDLRNALVKAVLNSFLGRL
jgi:hypothetical protein